MARNEELVASNIRVLFLRISPKPRNTPFKPMPRSEAFVLPSSCSLPSIQKIATAMKMPGTTFSTITSRQVKLKLMATPPITTPLSSMPATKGATASPTLPPMPWIDTTRPLRSGKRLARVGIAVGCQMVLPTPIRIAQASSIQ